ncbi:unnamed protein product [Meganyctiphanes norvegica]|uniref:DZIP3-like HEPN domain-containing protein n=1 Tax=Meganyctiphanes norvegica TaxID=48144 RepID=A0AAV2RYE2_MEGNR
MKKQKTTPEDLCKLNFEKCLDEGRMIMVLVCLVLLKGDMVSVQKRCAALSYNTLKIKYGFNRSQYNHVTSGMPLNKMDISLLSIIIHAFGGLNPGERHEDQQLQDDLRELKESRNSYVHEKQSSSMDKTKLKTKLKDTETLCVRIMEQLKSHCDPKIYPSEAEIDKNIGIIQNNFFSLQDTLYDHIKDKVGCTCPKQPMAVP